MFKNYRSSWWRVRSFFLRYERHISSAGLLIGFTIDNLTLTRIDLLFDNLVLIFYLCVAALGIILIGLGEQLGGKKLPGTLSFVARRMAPFLPFPVQFAFGGLLSGFLVFYSRSASLAHSWPFLLFLGGLLIGNEFLRSQYQKFVFRVAVFFIVLYSYFIFVVPVVIGAMGPWVFQLSTLLAVGSFSLFVSFYIKFVSSRVRVHKNTVAIIVAAIVFTLQILYFSNILPPIPLSLKDAGIYYAVEKRGNGYLVQDISQPWYQKVLPYSIVYWRPGERLYAFSAVFAPTKMTTKILHEWQYFEEESGSWRRSGLPISFSIIGGRDGGYRGYSFKRALRPGRWRVDVKTENGQLIGRIRFRIVLGAPPFPYRWIRK